MGSVYETGLSDLGLELEDDIDAYDYFEGSNESEHGVMGTEMDLDRARAKGVPETLNQRCGREAAPAAANPCAPLIPEALKALTPRTLIVSCMPCLPGALVRRL